MEFKKGDVVSWAGARGVVYIVSAEHSDSSPENPVGVKFDGRTYPVWFTLDGKLCDWHKEPSLILIERRLAVFRDSFPHLLSPWPLTWGGGDTTELWTQVKGASGAPSHSIFGRRWIDVKTLFQTRQFCRGEKLQSGLAKSMIKVGLTFQGRKHRATDAAINTFRLAHVHYLKKWV